MARCLQKPKENHPPPELIIGIDWRNYNTPYTAGGLRDQPIRLFRRIKLALHIYDALMMWKTKNTKTAKDNSEWNTRNAWVVDVVNKVSKLQNGK